MSVQLALKVIEGRQISMAQKTQAERDYLVFISHSEKDCWIAKQMATLIEEKG